MLLGVERHNAVMEPAKRKITAHRRDSEVIEGAPRKYLGTAALDAALDDSQGLSTLSEDEAMDLANAELHLMRAERAQRSD